METNFNGGISDRGPLICKVYLYQTNHNQVCRYGELKSAFGGGYLANSFIQLLNALKDRSHDQAYRNGNYWVQHKHNRQYN